MTERTEAEYFAGRAAAEHQLKLAAKDPRAAEVHAELAARYEELALEFDAIHREDLNSELNLPRRQLRIVAVSRREGAAEGRQRC